MTIIKTLVAAAAATLVIAGLASCTAIGSASERDETGESKPPAGATAEPSFADQPEPEPEVGNLAFGEAVTYVDGLSVSVSQPAPFVPSQYVTVAQPNNLRFTFTITNGTAENYDGYVYVTATSGGAAAEQVFDSQNNLTGPPSGTILPGQTISFDLGFSVADPASIVLSVAPGFSYEDAIFTNVG